MYSGTGRAQSVGTASRDGDESAYSLALYYGDCLDVLRESIADESVDLIYLDPPFNSNAI